MSETLRDALARQGITLDLVTEDESDANKITPVASFTCGGERYVLCCEEPRRLREEPRFSARELEIARLISRGHTTRTVAAVLEISPWTVSTYVRRMFAKLDVASRSALVAQLASLGLLDSG
ncbi:MAG TPA: helix-turn-helix transcriptional regulator [Solirubrobacteraceae bacterium]|nr:helix-turn-helix transcriptional regulator [Solirubrobacteraceae bacterium]